MKGKRYCNVRNIKYYLNKDILTIYVINCRQYYCVNSITELLVVRGWLGIVFPISNSKKPIILKKKKSEKWIRALTLILQLDESVDLLYFIQAVSFFLSHVLSVWVWFWGCSLNLGRFHTCLILKCRVP